ncbi:hypothetical protein EVAR_45056_1 [Eumeta japonica]|uniref:Uncharacterized protein n=1 Tax=Eumeta variegata TaxID=151549 RepID=A0A4C1ZEJ4_EUMVA|nr:hypothetical protein EVAR_45056_1 [Eumeta japonica]
MNHTGANDFPSPAQSRMNYGKPVYKFTFDPDLASGGRRAAAGPRAARRSWQPFDFFYFGAQKNHTMPSLDCKEGDLWIICGKLVSFTDMMFKKFHARFERQVRGRARVAVTEALFSIQSSMNKENTDRERRCGPGMF